MTSKSSSWTEGASIAPVRLSAGKRGVRFLTAPRGRASQMNTGAQHATGDWLLFLHADTLLPEGALARLNGLETDATVQAGGFLHRFSGTDWRLRMLSYFNNVRCRWSKIIYGDQAMFVRRTLFERLGGFPNEPRLEDVLFSRKLVCIVTPVLLAPPVVTDSRKFVQMGIWRSVFRASLILLSMEFGLLFVSRAFFRGHTMKKEGSSTLRAICWVPI